MPDTRTSPDPAAAAQFPRDVPSPRAGEKRLPALTPAPADALTRARRTGRLDAASYALARAQTLFRPEAVRARYGNVRRPNPRLATLILRDLAFRLADLDPAARKQADRLLARPTDGTADPQGQGYEVAEAGPVCAVEFCIHYVPSSADAPPLDDVSPPNGIPDWVEAAATTVAQVWATEVGTLAYRSPLSDETSANNGGDARLDIYLANLGAAGIYGYCTSDDPNAADPSYPYWDVSAYCVIDNDYLEQAFAASTPLQNMQATVAHEFFHAVQFAYDWFEDLWLMEGTAAWVEDEVYDGVNDNRQFLAASPLRHSFVPLDWGGDEFEYLLPLPLRAVRNRDRARHLDAGGRKRERPGQLLAPGGRPRARRARTKLPGGLQPLLARQPNRTQGVHGGPLLPGPAAHRKDVEAHPLATQPLRQLAHLPAGSRDVRLQAGTRHQQESKASDPFRPPLSPPGLGGGRPRLPPLGQAPLQPTRRPEQVRKRDRAHLVRTTPGRAGRARSHERQRPVPLLAGITLQLPRHPARRPPHLPLPRARTPVMKPSRVAPSRLRFCHLGGVRDKYAELSLAEAGAAA